MKAEEIKQFKGKNVNLTIDKKTLTGILVQLNENTIKLETDFGIVEIENSKITDMLKIEVLKDLFIYVCKNELLNCKGIRLITSKEKVNWACKYFKQFECPIKKICNLNDMPLKIKNSFLDGMHSEIPVIGEMKKKSKMI